MTRQKVAVPERRPLLQPLLAGDGVVNSNVTREACALRPLLALKGVLFPPGGVSNCRFCQRASRDDRTAQDYIHIGVGALSALVVLRMSLSVISKALGRYG